MRRIGGYMVAVVAGLAMAAVGMGGGLALAGSMAIAAVLVLAHSSPGPVLGALVTPQTLGAPQQREYARRLGVRGKRYARRVDRVFGAALAV